MTSALETASERGRVTLELAELAEAVMEQNLRRRFPHASDEEIARRLDEWFAERPGAKWADSPGRPVSFPRTKK